MVCTFEKITVPSWLLVDFNNDRLWPTSQTYLSSTLLCKSSNVRLLSLQFSEIRSRLGTNLTVQETRILQWLARCHNCMSGLSGEEVQKPINASEWVNTVLLFIYYVVLEDLMIKDNWKLQLCMRTSKSPVTSHIEPLLAFCNEQQRSMSIRKLGKIWWDKYYLLCLLPVADPGFPVGGAWTS